MELTTSLQGHAETQNFQTIQQAEWYAELPGQLRQRMAGYMDLCDAVASDTFVTDEALVGMVDTTLAELAEQGYLSDMEEAMAFLRMPVDRCPDLVPPAGSNVAPHADHNAAMTLETDPTAFDLFEEVLHAEVRKLGTNFNALTVELRTALTDALHGFYAVFADHVAADLAASTRLRQIRNEDGQITFKAATLTAANPDARELRNVVMEDIKADIMELAAYLQEAADATIAIEPQEPVAGSRARGLRLRREATPAETFAREAAKLLDGYEGPRDAAGLEAHAREAVSFYVISRVIRGGIAAYGYDEEVEQAYDLESVDWPMRRVRDAARIGITRMLYDDQFAVSPILDTIAVQTGNHYKRLELEKPTAQENDYQLNEPDAESRYGLGKMPVVMGTIAVRAPQEIADRIAAGDATAARAPRQALTTEQRYAVILTDKMLSDEARGTISRIYRRMLARPITGDPTRDAALFRRSLTANGGIFYASDHFPRSLLADSGILGS